MENNITKLSKVKILPDGGLTIDYVAIADGEQTEHTITSTKSPHPDFFAAAGWLKQVVAEVLGLLSFKSLGPKLSVDAEKSLDEHAAEVIDRVEIRGVSWSGTGDKAGVVVSAVLETPSGLKCAVNTPRLLLSPPTLYGWEKALNNGVALVHDETLQYLFKGKAAQMSLFGEEEPEGAFMEK